MTRTGTHVVACTACGEDALFLLRAHDWNRRLSDTWFRYHQCSGCGLILLANPPADLDRYYDAGYHASPSLRELERLARKESYQLDLLTPHVQEGRLVEIGPGAEVFAYQARHAGFSVTTIEMDEACCSHLEAVVGVTALHNGHPEKVIASLPPSKAVVLWQSLEHLPNLCETLEAILKNLAEEGVLLIATPNPAALGFRLMKARWPHIDAPRHLHLIPPEMLTRWLAKRGMRRIALNTADLGARRWNRFAWQRLLLNSVPTTQSKGLEVAGLAAGAAVSALLSTVELRGRNCSSYTAVFRKDAGV